MMLVTSDDYLELGAQCWTELPGHWRRDGLPCDWSIANGRGLPVGSFLEGPDLAADGTLYCVDIPFGRIFSVSPAGGWSLVAEYEGWPNGLKVQADGRLLVADHRIGLVEIDPWSGTPTPLLTHRHSQRFLGLNDLQIAQDGAVWFTDQGQTGLQDASGRVYRWVRGEAPTCVLDGLPSPNGLRVSADGGELFVAVTRDNSVWRAPLRQVTQPTKVGRFAMFYGPVGPDGLHVDSAHRVWVCLPGADTIWVLNRKGEVNARVRFPAGAMPTNLVLDEANRRAYVTCSGLQAIFTIGLRSQLDS